MKFNHLKFIKHFLSHDLQKSKTLSNAKSYFYIISLRVEISYKIKTALNTNS
jgi:hypothetical protein